MKSEKILKGIAVAAFCLQVLIQFLTVAVLWQLNMLPEKYMLILVLAFGLLIGLCAFMVFYKGKKGKVGKARHIVAIVLALVLALGCGVIYKVASDVHETMRQVTTPDAPSTLMNVYVLRDDPAQTLADAASYTFATTTMFDSEKTTRAVEELEAQIGAAVTTASFPSVPDMVDALYGGEVGAILLNSAYTVLLDENEVYAGFSEKTRVLHQISVTDPVPETTVPETTEPAPTEETLPEGYIAPFTVYISGMDTESSVRTVSRSDVNILVTVDPQNRQVLLVNTPRDYYIPNPAGGGSLDKLTHCGIYGIDCSIQALSDLYDTPIDYYARINFTGVKTLVDAVGGVTVYSDVAFTATGQHYIQQGANQLNGEQALAFARERYVLAGGDNARGKNQMKVIAALIDKMTSSTVLMSNYAQILESLEGMFVTDMPSELISQLVKLQLEDMQTKWQIRSYAVTGVCGSRITYSMPGFYASVMFCDDGMVSYGSQLMQKVRQGQLLTQEEMTYPG